jgi:hypothetical protein
VSVLYTQVSVLYTQVSVLYAQTINGTPDVTSPYPFQGRNT